MWLYACLCDCAPRLPPQDTQAPPSLSRGIFITNRATTANSACPERSKDDRNCLTKARRLVRRSRFPSRASQNSAFFVIFYSEKEYRTAIPAPGGTLMRVARSDSSPDEQHAKTSSKVVQHDRTWNYPSRMKQALNRESATRYMSKWRKIYLHNRLWTAPFDSLGMSHLDLAFRRSVRRSLHQRCDKRATVQIAT